VVWRLAPLLVLPWLAIACGVDPPTRPPNVVLIVADDLGIGDVGAYGGEEIPTPSIDGLAREGVRFSQGYVSAPVCAPTRAGLLTGRDHNRFGHPRAGTYVEEMAWGTGLPLSEVLLSERLRKHGYATGVVGKWHLGSQAKFRPLARGFDSFFGFLTGAHQAFDWGNGLWGPVFRDADPAEGEGFLTAAITREAVDFIERHRDVPFFLYVAYDAVHAPLEAPTEAEARFAHIPNLPRRTLAAMLHVMDEGVGEISAALESAGLSDDTLLIFLSDNGANLSHSSNGKLRGWKGQLLEGGIRVPFLMRWPSVLPAGVVYDEVVTSLDVFPTVLAAAGAPAPGDRVIDGVDLLRYIDGNNSAAPHEVLGWRYRERWALRRGDLKLVRHRIPGAGGELAVHLYDLSADPGERRDLSAERPDDAASLRRDYDAWLAGLAG
jgi:arylsulfatase A-like enzyme